MTSHPDTPRDLAGARLLEIRACTHCGSVVTLITSGGEVNHEREHAASHKRAEARLRGLEARLAALEEHIRRDE
jgi:hypothetical protein